MQCTHLWWSCKYPVCVSVCACVCVSVHVSHVHLFCSFFFRRQNHRSITPGSVHLGAAWGGCQGTVASWGKTFPKWCHQCWAKEFHIPWAWRHPSASCFISRIDWGSAVFFVHARRRRCDCCQVCHACAHTCAHMYSFLHFCLAPTHIYNRARTKIVYLQVSREWEVPWLHGAERLVSVGIIPPARQRQPVAHEDPHRCGFPPLPSAAGAPTKCGFPPLPSAAGAPTKCEGARANGWVKTRNYCLKNMCDIMKWIKKVLFCVKLNLFHFQFRSVNTNGSLLLARRATVPLFASASKALLKQSRCHHYLSSFTVANVKVMTGKVPSLKILLKSYSINISNFISCLRKQLINSSFYSFLFVSPDLEPAQETFEHETSSFYMLGVSPLQSTRLLEQVTGLPFRTTREQVHLISSISNFHWWTCLGQDGQKIIQKRLHKEQRLLFNPCPTEFYKYIPASPRNQICYFLMKGFERRLHQTIRYCVAYDREEEESVIESTQRTISDPPKRRKYGQKIVRATPDEFFDDLSVAEQDRAEIRNAAQKRSQFQSFSEELLSHGVLQWRKLSDDINIVIMSDYCEESGKLQPLKYVHVTARTGERRVMLKCTCGIYKKICGTAMKRLHLAEGVEEAVLDEDFTCMHCKFYKKYLHEHRGEVLNQEGSTHVISSLQVNTAGVGDPVTLVGPASIKTTTKLSVLAGDTCSIVNVHFTPAGGCFDKCQNGMCHVHFRNKKKSPNIQPWKRKRGNCRHMETLQTNIETLKNIFPMYFALKDDANSDADAYVDPFAEEEDNNGDFFCRNSTSKISFSVDTGLWDHGATSQYQPTLNEWDPHLIQSTGEHHEHVTASNILPTGLYQGPKLVLSLQCECACKSGYTNEAYPEGKPAVPDGTTKVYTQSDVLDCQLFTHRCVNETCDLCVNYTGQEDEIFFWSKGVGFGQEPFWDFMNAVIGGQMSFTRFCTERTRVYLTTNLKLVPFVSNKTFIQAVMSWMVSFQLDFRQHVDPWCQHNPKIFGMWWHKGWYFSETPDSGQSSHISRCRCGTCAISPQETVQVLATIPLQTTQVDQPAASVTLRMCGMQKHTWSLQWILLLKVFHSSKIRVSEIRATETRISSKHRKLHGAIFVCTFMHENHDKS